MTTLKELKERIVSDPGHWKVHLMDFVDDFRCYKDVGAIVEPFELDNSRIDALLASTCEYLCDELGIEPPEWLANVPACDEPYFVSGVENLKSFTIVESPAHFRVRKIFVLENFLSRA